MAKHVYQGLAVTAKYLTVYYADRLGSVDRVQSVKIPIGDLTRPEVLDAVDHEMRRALRAHWQSGEVPLPLPEESGPPWGDG